MLNRKTITNLHATSHIQIRSQLNKTVIYSKTYPKKIIYINKKIRNPSYFSNHITTLNYQPKVNVYEA